MYDAFILAAGYGSRLRPLTSRRPKPLVPVCGVPLLAYSLALCHKHGLRTAVVNAHWLAEQVAVWAGRREGVEVDVAVELPHILGTGGGLRAVADRLADRFVVLNGDVLHEVDLAALRAAVPDGGAAMALCRDPVAAPKYGIVAADGEGVVARLTTVARAEPVGPLDETTFFSGIHAMHRDALAPVPDGFACVVRTAYRALVPERRVRGLAYTGPWLDAGDPESYLDANLAVLRREVSLTLDPHARAAFAHDGVRAWGDSAVVARAHLDGAVWVGQGARIGAGCRLRDVVVGAGAEIPPGTSLEGVVVWDGATVPAGDWRRAIAFDERVIAVSA